MCPNVGQRIRSPAIISFYDPPFAPSIRRSDGSAGRSTSGSAFKLCITTDEIDDDPRAAARFLRRYGLRWAEIRNIWGPYNTDQPMERIRQARAILDEQGIQVSVLDTGFFKILLPPDTPEGHRKLDEQWKLLDAAQKDAGEGKAKDALGSMDRALEVAETIRLLSGS